MLVLEKQQGENHPTRGRDTLADCRAGIAYDATG